LDTRQKICPFQTASKARESSNLKRKLTSCMDGKKKKKSVKQAGSRTMRRFRRGGLFGKKKI